MGNQRTEAARESSDLVILNKDFASVVLALMWGRCVQNNIQKFIQFQLTANVVALVNIPVKAASAGGTPLIPVQLLWVNIVINTLGALALATERPTKELMHEPPVARSPPLITNVMWRNLLTQSLFQIYILLIFQFKGKSIYSVDEKVKNTIIFNTFVLCQVFNKFNSQKLAKRNVFEGIHKSYLFLGIIGMTITLQVEFLLNFVDTDKLDDCNLSDISFMRISVFYYKIITSGTESLEAYIGQVQMKLTEVQTLIAFQVTQIANLESTLCRL
ncbi:putative calcium-transporting ATPase 13, plasma membrane-type protein [Tanacetum coccineum]